VRYSEVSADGTVEPPRRVFKSTPEPSIGSASLSPDGRFLAYAERQPGGRVEVLMTQFPTGEGRWQVSRDGGSQPVWTRETGELIFVGGMPGGPRSLMAARIRLAPDVVVGTPLKLFDVGEGLTEDFDVTSDATRFLLIRQRTDAGRQNVRWVLLQNWVADAAPRR